MTETSDTFDENDISIAFKDAQKALNMPEAIVYRLVEKFIHSTRDSIEKLANAVDKADYEEIKMVAHNIKGSAATLRFDAMSNVALEIESSAKEQKPIDYTARVDTLSRQLGKIDDFYQKARK